MRRVRRAVLRLVAVSAALVLGCGPGEDRAAHDAHEPVALHDQEDEVCGMVVREQSAPRSQVVHGDGSRFFFCSIGDMLVHLSAPSPHGRPGAVFVEVMDPQEDPDQAHTGAHGWARVEDAHYVVGIPRPGIMGAPILTYATRADAEELLARRRIDGGVQILDADGLRAWWDAREAAR